MQLFLVEINFCLHDLAIAFNRLFVTALSHTQNSKYCVQVPFYGAVKEQ
jgi:hypothetical protein